MENASRASFLRSSFQVSEVYSSWQPHGHYYLQLLSHYANSGIENPGYSLKASHQMKGPHPFAWISVILGRLKKSCSVCLQYNTV